jgi:murein DD-endopeptidase MepM/ murein hydrolase activator NlpD
VLPLVIIGAYDPPAHDWLAGHRGVDLRTRLGQPVRAAGAGKVAFAGAIAGRGVVVVDHGELRTTYEPVRAGVRRGERVAEGERIGVIAAGSGHCGDGHSCISTG